MIEKYDLKGEDVARRLGVSTRRVYGWLSVGQTTPIPTNKLQLLELLLHSENTAPVWGVRAYRAPPSKKKRVRRTKKRRRVGKAK